jgi:hypothetical protein
LPWVCSDYLRWTNVWTKGKRAATDSYNHLKYQVINDNRANDHWARRPARDVAEPSCPICGSLSSGDVFPQHAFIMGSFCKPAARARTPLFPSLRFRQGQRLRGAEGADGRDRLLRIYRSHPPKESRTGGQMPLRLFASPRLAEQRQTGPPRPFSLLFAPERFTRMQQSLNGTHPVPAAGDRSAQQRDAGSSGTGHAAASSRPAAANRYRRW